MPDSGLWQQALKIAAEQIKVEAGMRMLLARDEDYEEWLASYHEEKLL